jgi:NADP-dependent 3-hydroxy acid dehydrogenase YdfG
LFDLHKYLFERHKNAAGSLHTFDPSFNNKLKIMKKTILITGASSGIGKATAILFQKKGWNVIATMRKPEEERELSTLENVLVTHLDVTDAETITKAVALGIGQFGKIDVLLNNAGYGAYGPLEATPIEKIERQFGTNVIGLLNTTKAVLGHFRQNKSGVIINISSVGGKITFPLGTLYHGTKFAVEGISEALHYEMNAIGVKVRIVEPGMVATDFGGRSFDFNNDETLAEYQGLVQGVFAGFGSAQESASTAASIAEVIYRAATDDSDQLRYPAGKDAEMLLSKRQAENDETFLKDIKNQFATRPAAQ